MHSRISFRLLLHHFVKYKRWYDISHVTRPLLVTSRNLSISPIHQFQDEEASTKFVSKVSDARSDLDEESSTSESCGNFDDLVDDEPDDEFAYENDDVGTIDIEAITNNDPEKIEVLKVVLRDLQLMRDQGYPFLPSKIPVRRWKALMNCHSFKDRQAMFRHLSIIEKKNLAEKIRKEAKRSRLQKTPKKQRPNLSTSSPLEYNLNRNSLCTRQNVPTMHSFLNYRLAKAEWLGSSLIIDCGYESYMNFKEIHRCSSQLILAWVANRNSCNPFNMIFCNTDDNSSLYQKFATLIPQVGTPESPVNFTKKHYVDLFPPEKLIYLSPHSEHIMDKFESDSVYIIGAFVDEMVHDPVSADRAKRDGLRTVKFPLDTYLNWCQGSQFLPINQCVTILSRLRDGHPWDEALRCIARRKVNCVGLHFNKEPKIDLKSTRHMQGIYSYEMGKEPSKRKPTEIEVV